MSSSMPTVMRHPRPIVVSAGKTRLTARLNVTNFANPVIDGNYEGVLVLQELRKFS